MFKGKTRLKNVTKTILITCGLVSFCLSLLFNVAFQPKSKKLENVPVINKNKQGNKENGNYPFMVGQ